MRIIRVIAVILGPPTCHFASAALAFARNTSSNRSSWIVFLFRAFGKRAAKRIFQVLILSAYPMTFSAPAASMVSAGETSTPPERSARIKSVSTRSTVLQIRIACLPCRIAFGFDGAAGHSRQLARNRLDIAFMLSDRTFRVERTSSESRCSACIRMSVRAQSTVSDIDGCLRISCSRRS